MPYPAPHQALIMNFLCACSVFLSPGILFATASDDAVEALLAKGAKIKRDNTGTVTEVNLAEADVSETDLRQLANFPDLNRLTLWGAGITDTAIPLLEKNPKLATQRY